MSKQSSVRTVKQLTRKQISRREKEQRLQQRLVLGTALVLGLVVLVLAWGLYDQYVLRPSQPVATVYGVPIRLDTYQQMVRYWRYSYRNVLNNLEAQKQRLGNDESQAFLAQYMDQQIRTVQGQLMRVDMDTLDRLIDDQLIRRECALRGITVTPEEVQLEIEQQFGYDRNPPTPEPITVTLPITVTPTPTIAPMTKEQFTERLGSVLKGLNEAAKMSEADFRRLIEQNLYRQKLEEALTAELPTTAEQVHARHILVKTREEAEAVLARLKGGEEFEVLAAELSEDTSNKEQGGDLGWFPRGMMVPEFDEAVFALQPGQLSGVIETQFGAHIIRVDEREASRALEPNALQQAQSKALDDWYTAQRAASEVVRSWNSNMVPRDTTGTTRRR